MHMGYFVYNDRQALIAREAGFADSVKIKVLEGGERLYAGVGVALIGLVVALF